MQYPEEIQDQVNKAQQWFEVECRTNDITPKIRVSVAREIQKQRGDNPVTVALLSLVLAGEVANPKQFSVVDIENALWLVRDLRLGFDESAPIAVKHFK